MNLNYDLMIIGSGPAGLAAAIIAYSKGLKVVMVPGKKSTNNELVESLHPGVFSLLEHLGIGKIPDNCIAGTYLGISNGTIQKSLNPYSNEVWTGFHVNKNSFGKFLYQYCKNLGITILEEEKVKSINIVNDHEVILQTEAQTLKGNYILDCSGSKRFAGRKLKFPFKVKSDVYIVKTGFSSGIRNYKLSDKIAYFFQLKHGWVWIAKLYDGRYYWTGLSKKTGGVGKKIEHSFKELIDPSVAAVSNQRWWNYTHYIKDNVFLCGDAAYNIDPAAGQGVLNALRQGIMAATITSKIFEYPERKNFFERAYSDWMKNEINEKQIALRAMYTELGVQ